ncbi:MAG: hypothetical protein L3K26_12010, partial [Candidatus Hydrogenedentes bacterium]|nr:hypothetical protein [Candidatus Hydrogenedentota bacterium]
IVMSIDTVITSIYEIKTVTYYNAGTVLDFDLDYWSLDPIKDVNFYRHVDGGDAEEISSSAHIDNFQEDSQTEELLYSYTPETASPTPWAWIFFSRPFVTWGIQRASLTAVTVCPELPPRPLVVAQRSMPS